MYELIVFIDLHHSQGCSVGGGGGGGGGMRYECQRKK